MVFPLFERVCPVGISDPYGVYVLPKFEYGHLYKFAVSLGLLMVALGLALPWLVLRESGSLLIPESELDALTPRARRVLLNKQGDQEWIAGNYRYASIGLVVTGLAVGSFGFVKWARRQSVADEIEDTQRDTAQAQLRQLTPSETSERLDQESAEVLAEEAAPLEVEDPGERQRRFAYVRKKIERVEQHVFGLIEAEFQSTHRVLTQVRLPTGEGTVPVDAFLLALSPTTPAMWSRSSFFRALTRKRSSTGSGMPSQKLYLQPKARRSYLDVQWRESSSLSWPRSQRPSSAQL